MAEYTNTRASAEMSAPKSGLGLDFRPASNTKWSTPPYRTETSYGPGSTIVNMENAHLSNADLRWQNFRGASMHHANMEGAMLWGATLKNADLSHADLSKADLTGSDITGADLSKANTEGACFVGARYNQETRFPKGFGDPKSKGCVAFNEAMQVSCN